MTMIERPKWNGTIQMWLWTCPHGEHAITLGPTPYIKRTLLMQSWQTGDRTFVGAIRRARQHLTECKAVTS